MPWCGNLVPRVFRLPTSRDGETKDPGNEVVSVGAAVFDNCVCAVSMNNIARHNGQKWFICEINFKVQKKGKTYMSLFLFIDLCYTSMQRAALVKNT